MSRYDHKIETSLEGMKMKRRIPENQVFAL